MKILLWTVVLLICVGLISSIRNCGTKNSYQVKGTNTPALEATETEPDYPPVPRRNKVYTPPRLPPKPDPARAVIGLKGIDTNKNGVRDEVEIALIQKHGSKIEPTAMKALLNYAANAQAEMDGRRRGPEILGKNSYLIECMTLAQAYADLRAQGIDPYAEKSRGIVAEVASGYLYEGFSIAGEADSLTADTKERKIEMRDANNSADGMIVGGYSTKELGRKCGL